MPTLNLSRRIAVGPDDPLDGPGCHAVTEACPGVSRGWLVRLPESGPRRRLEPSREVYHPSRGMTLRTFTELAPGTYEAHSALDEGRAHRVVFEVEGESRLLSRFRIVSPAEGKPAQLALWDPCRAQADAGPGRLEERVDMARPVEPPAS